MKMSKVTHVKSIPIIANHMPAHVYPYLMLLLLLLLKGIFSYLECIERKRPLQTCSREHANGIHMLMGPDSGGPAGVLYSFWIVWLGSLSTFATLSELTSM